MAAKYFDTFPCDLWSLPNFFYCIKYSDDSLSLEEIHRLFYRQLSLIAKDLEVSEIVRSELARTKKDDIEKLENMWSQRDQRNTFRDRTNDILVPSGSETVAASAALSKKRKTSDEEGAVSRYKSSTTENGYLMQAKQIKYDQ
ncbi:hypothetical protein F8M41_023191 [Gigaspora margarita]|uniref:Uncharacterized protein n=1 Tax=Gigaspora margarita TaxID=4874 RepID=A0A8H4EHF8_GIGMA|nr:hypothetical protein F8M41_023191 [Gigaspora margarita]